MARVKIRLGFETGCSGAAIFSILRAREILYGEASGRGPGNGGFNPQDVVAHSNAYVSHLSPVLSQELRMIQ